MVIVAGSLIVSGCVLVGYGITQDQVRRGLLPAGRADAPRAARQGLSLLAGAALLVLGQLALAAAYGYAALAALAAAYLGCHFLTYAWGTWVLWRTARIPAGGRRAALPAAMLRPAVLRGRTPPEGERSRSSPRRERGRNLQPGSGTSLRGTLALPLGGDRPRRRSGRQAGPSR